MPDQPKKFYLTTPIYYVNARPHIGHAYTTIVADVLARRHRLLGDATYFLTGTDEHGQKIERSAAAAGIPPQQFADQVSKTFRDLWARMGITHDQFIRTTSPDHACGVQKLFTTLYEKGFIYLASYTGSYCVSDEAFIDAPVGTPCPDCGRLLEEVTEENFFFKLSAFQAQLIDLIESNTLLITPDSSRNEVLSFLRGNVQTPSTDGSSRPTAPSTDGSSRPTNGSGETPVFVAATTSSPTGVAAGFSPRNTNPQDGGASAPALATSATGTPYVPGALKDLSISRSSFTWGIPVPEPAASTAAQKHVIYVWLDALANYMTALGYGAVNEDGSAGDETLFQKFWPADLHLVGKEITRFHCIYWPAFLLAAGIDLPKQITAHGWLLFDNSKMSKSKGNIVRTETILSAFGTLCPPPLSTSPYPVILSEGAEPHPAPQSKDPDALHAATTAGTFPITEPTPHDRDLFAADVLRYYLLREIPFGQDGSFSFEALITRYNADLANGYGNLVSRTLKMISQYCEGTVPAAEGMRDPDKNRVPEHWNSSALSSRARFRDTPDDPFLQHGYLTVRDAANQAGLSIDAMLGVHGGKYFYGEDGGVTPWEFFQVALDPLVKLTHEDFDATKLTDLVAFIATQLKYIDGFLSLTTPWKKEDSKHQKVILGIAAESIRIITALLYPILPYATARVWAQLGLGDIELAARNGQLKDLTWGGLQPGTKLGPLGPIFPRADKGLAQIMTDHEETLAAGSSQLKAGEQTPTSHASTDPAAPPRTSTLAEPALTVGGSHAHTTGPTDIPSHKDIPGSGIFATPPAPAPEAAPQITIDDFAKIELRVAAITLAERIPKADKLLRLEVDLGPHGQRQILAGIAEFYTPEELIGRRIVVITNLAPRKMRGLESHGMLLAASDGDHGKPHLATCGPDIPLGSRLK